MEKLGLILPKNTFLKNPSNLSIILKVVPLWLIGNGVLLNVGFKVKTVTTFPLKISVHMISLTMENI